MVPLFLSLKTVIVFDKFIVIIKPLFFVLFFLKTYRLSDDESLFNPANYQQYRIIDEYVVCGCPTTHVNITNPVITSESRTRIYRKVYTGTIQCQLDHICSDIIEGEGRVI